MKCFLIGASFLVFALVVLAQTMPPQDSAANAAHQISRVRAETTLANTHAPFHASWNSLAEYRTPDWFRDAKFGIFLHGGVYSVPAFGNE
jgi:alpha-L-fucosidase